VYAASEREGLGLIKNFIIKMSLSAVFILLFSIRFVDVTIGEKITEYPLETAWKVTGLPLMEVDTETWVKLNDRWLSVYDLKQVANQLVQKLSLTSKTKLTCGEQNEFNYVSFEGLQRDGTIVTVTLQSSSMNSIGETQLGINTSHNGKINNLRFYLNSLKTKISKVGNGAHFNVLLSGERHGKISPVLVKELAGKAFRKVEAELVASGFANGNSSQKGYTRLIKDEVRYDCKRINIEIGTRYDEARNVTEIIIASPNMTDGV
jgi:hypothetical protein